MVETDENAALTPEASLALIQDQQRDARRRLDVDLSVFLVPWGVAWLVGYGLLFLRHGPDDRILVDMPSWLPLAVLFGLLVGAGVYSSIATLRAVRGVGGVSAERGAMYMWSWFVAFSAFGVIAPRFEEHLPDAQFGLLMGALPVFVAGILYMSGGAVWHDRRQFAIGVWLSAINVVGVLAGPGWHSLVVAVLGGGGMLAAAPAIRWARDRASEASAPA